MASCTVPVTREDGKPVATHCRVARTPLARARGLLGRKKLTAGEGMLFPATRAVHTHFMRFPIDVVFLDRDNCIVRIAENVRPWRAVSCRQARSVLELGSGCAANLGLREGDRVEPESRDDRG